MRAFCVALAVLAVLPGCGGAGSDTPEGTTETFFEAVGKGDAKEACSHVKSPVQREGLAVDVFRPLVRGTPARAGDPCEEVVAALPAKRREELSNVEIGSTTSAGPATLVEASLSGTRHNVTLNKVGDEWKVAVVGAER